MKMHMAQLITLASLILSVAAQAATPTTELKVKGIIGTPSCTVNAPDGGIYNIGEVSSTNIKAGVATTVLPSISKTWTVTCDSQTFLSLTAYDNRKASSSDSTSIHSFGLGFVNGSGKIGFYRTTMSNATVDGVSSFLYFIDANNVLQGGHTLETLTNNFRFGWSETTTTAKSGKIFSADFTVIPTLAGAATMGGAITENINIDGSTTMNFAFAI
ncbi:beta-fimbriae major subunit [Yersinia frederiksenii]|nr:beta-fimbriae major subunit [Yersinia frederiksenii]CNG40940.1 beta-fimbriae major subunit [Yersinia frederiksenii]